MDTASRLSAAIYDPFFWPAERAGLAERRRALVAQAHGRVLEIGAGTGLNAAYYADDIDLTLSEPDEAMAARLRSRLDALGRSTEVVMAAADALPFADASFDTVVSTLVLCTVRDLDGTLAEIERVLRPDGRLLFLEHILDPSGRWQAWQRRLTPLQKRWACGCHLDRPTPDTLAARGFALDGVRAASMPKAPPMFRPLAVGAARPPSARSQSAPSSTQAPA